MQQLLPWDLQLLQQIETFFFASASYPLIQKLMIFLSTLGDHGLVWILLTLLLLFFPKTRRIGLGVALALALGTLFGEFFLKNLVGRLRPFHLVDYALVIPPPSGFSFPSSHSLSSFAAATAITLNNRKVGIPALILAGGIAFSRLFLFVHYPSDVLAGSLLGIAFGFLGSSLSHKLAHRFPWFAGSHRL